MQSTQNQEIKLNNGMLLFKPEKKTCDYGFIFKYDENNLKISFELQLTFLGIQNQNYATYKISRKSMFINNQVPDLMVYQIANEMTNGIYPIEFTINQNLECVSINNHKEMLGRCQEIEQKIANYYHGEIPEKMLVTFKENYSDQKNIIKHIQNDLAFQILFFPMYKAYNHLLQSKTSHKWTVNEKVVEFELEQKIEKCYNDNGKVVVHITSTENKQNQNSYQATYHLHPKKHTVASATGKIEYLNDKETEILYYECYHLNP